MNTQKVIATNVKAFRSKYGRNGWQSIKAAIDVLVAADAKRGVSTTLIALDNKTQMKKLNGTAVVDHSNPRQNKIAIDAIYDALAPDYIMILGSPDIVPHQPLRNPIPDPDRNVPSDIPYACNAPYSLKAEDFKGPTRVVGRLPDIAGKREPQYLVDLLKKASLWRPRNRKTYENYFAVSAAVWKGSTRLSLKKVFGGSRRLQLSPKAGPNWTKKELRPRLHFLNLHGAAAEPNFYGEGPPQAYHLAHTSARLPGRMRNGSVVVAECCYGADLYDPDWRGAEPGICNTVLAAGAYGFLGSTTIAYGPANSNGAADLICQYFVREVLKGASLGRAFLQARQEFVTQNAPLAPTDLKTIAQFFLIGDPSVHPVRVSQKAMAKGPKAKSMGTLARRRKTLLTKGLFLFETIAGTRSVADHQPDDQLQSMLMKIVKDLDLPAPLIQKSFKVHKAFKPLMAKSLPQKRRAAGGGAFHLMVTKRDASKPKSMPRTTARAGAKIAGVQDTILILAKEVNGKIEEVKQLYAR